MAYFQRLISVFIFLFFSSFAHAQVTYEYQEPSCGVPGVTLSQWGSETLAAFLAVSPTYAGSYWSLAPHFYNGGTLYCQGTIYRMYNGGPNGSQGRSVGAVCSDNTWSIDASLLQCKRSITVPTCVPPEVLVDGVCAVPYDPPECVSPMVLVDGQCVQPYDPPCPYPQTRIDGVCQDPPDCAVPAGGEIPGSGGAMTGANYGGGPLCHTNCVGDAPIRGQVDGKWFAWGPLTSRGTTCSGADPTSSVPPGDPDDPVNPAPPSSPSNPPPPQCPVGQCPGSINGTDVCKPCHTSTSTSSSNSTSNSNSTNPDGSSGSNPSGQPNGTTNTSTTKKTTCTGDKCTTDSTTTTTTPDGVVTTKTDKKEEKKEDFCASNPKSPMCIEGSFGGACAGGFQCTGDAVQCATAKAANEQMCAMKVDINNAIVGLGNLSLGGGNGADHPKNSVTDVDVGMLNQTNPWGAGCPADKVLTTFMGNTITVPLSSACSSFQMMGNVLVGLALLSGAFIVVGRK